MKKFQLDINNLRLKRSIIENKLYDVIDEKEFIKDINKLDKSGIAVHTEEGYILPVKNINYKENIPGVYIGDTVSVIVNPNNDTDKEIYSDKNMIDLASTDTKEYIKKKRELDNMEKNILYSDNPNHYNISSEDLPEMQALKKAINMKSIDIHTYEYKFGDKFQNNIRLLNKESISLQKLKEFADSLDLKISIIIEDRSPEVPNPMNDKVVMEITSSNDNIDDDNSNGGE